MCHVLKISLFLFSCLSLQYADARYEQPQQESKPLFSKKTQILMAEFVTGACHGVYIEHCLSLNNQQNRAVGANGQPSYSQTDGIPLAQPISPLRSVASVVPPKANSGSPVTVTINNGSSSLVPQVSGPIVNTQTSSPASALLHKIAQNIPVDDPTKMFKKHPKGATFIVSLPLRSVYNRDFLDTFPAEGALAHGVGQYAVQLAISYAQKGTIDFSTLTNKVNWHMVIGGLFLVNKKINGVRQSSDR